MKEPARTIFSPISWNVTSNTAASLVILGGVNYLRSEPPERWAPFAWAVGIITFQALYHLVYALLTRGDSPGVSTTSGGAS